MVLAVFGEWITRAQVTHTLSSEHVDCPRHTHLAKEDALSVHTLHTFCGRLARILSPISQCFRNIHTRRHFLKQTLILFTNCNWVNIRVWTMCSRWKMCTLRKTRNWIRARPSTRLNCTTFAEQVSGATCNAITGWRWFVEHTHTHSHLENVHSYDCLLTNRACLPIGLEWNVGRSRRICFE